MTRKLLSLILPFAILSFGAIAQPIIPISTARNLSATSVRVQGTVLNNGELGTIRYIQDASGEAVAVYNASYFTTNLINIGDSLDVTGIVANYNNLAEFGTTGKPATISLISTGAHVPAAIEFSRANWASAFNEAYEGKLVRLRRVPNIVRVGGSNGSLFTGNTNYTLAGNTTLLLRANTGVSVVGTPLPLDTFDVTGIMSQFCTSPATGCTSGYQLLVTTANDISYVPAPLISLAGSANLCSGEGPVTLSAPAGYEAYSWSNGANTQSITVSEAGNYTVQVQEGGVFSLPSLPVPVTGEIKNVVLQANAGTVLCQNTPALLLSPEVTGSGGIDSWTRNGIFYTIDNAGAAITVSQPGNYAYRHIENGCTSLTSNTVTVSTAPVPVINAEGPLTFCLGGSVTLTSSNPLNNLWSNGQAGESITVTASGIYAVQTVENGCTSALSNVINVAVKPLPVAPTVIEQSAAVFCEGGSVVLSSSAVNGNLWSTGETTRDITVSTSGFYYAKTIENGCTSVVSNFVEVRVNTIPAAPNVTAQGSLTFCEGSMVTLHSDAASGNIWSNGETTQDIVVSNAGDYSVRQQVSGCTSAVSRVSSVTVTPLPTAGTISANGPLTFCEGSSITLTSSLATGNLWSTNETGPFINLIEGSTITLRQVSNGCTSLPSAPVVVTVNSAVPRPAVTTSGPLTFCNGNTVTLTSNYANGNVWSNGETTQSITVSESGNYSVLNITNGCTSESSPVSAVTVNAVPAKPLISASGPIVFCDGGSVTLTSSAAAGNVWSTGESTQSITVNATGTYTVSNVASGCTSVVSEAAVVTVRAMPAIPNISASGSLAICSGGSVTLTSDRASDNLWSTGETTESITVSAAGSYTLQGVSSGCTSAVSAAAVVRVNMPSASTLNEFVCPGIYNFGDLMISLPGTYNRTLPNAAGCDSIITLNLTWKPTSAVSLNQSICRGESFTFNAQTYTAAGTYTARNLNRFGCDSTITLNLTVNPLPAVPLITRSSDSLLTTATGTLLWMIDDNAIPGANGRFIIPTANGNYSVKVTDTNGCSSKSEYFNFVLSTEPRISGAYGFKLHPNPASVNIVLNGLSAGTEVNISNLLGQVVLQEAYNGTGIHIAGLPIGMYLVNTKGRGMQRFVKE
ncbi:MAG: T9SS type A sorting domain-containing protein [Bacteroidota bacterium]